MSFWEVSEVTTAAITVMAVSIGGILMTFSFCLFKVLTGPIAEVDDE
jgi:hypothetical protein